MSIRILEFRPHQKNSLLGFAKIELPSGLIITDVVILTGERGPWASPPSKPQLDRDGNVLRDQNGKIRYSPIIEFTDRETRTRWSNAVIEALRAAHPEALGRSTGALISTPRTLKLSACAKRIRFSSGPMPTRAVCVRAWPL